MDQTRKDFLEGALSTLAVAAGRKSAKAPFTFLGFSPERFLETPAEVIDRIIRQYLASPHSSKPRGDEKWEAQHPAENLYRYLRAAYGKRSTNEQWSDAIKSEVAVVALDRERKLSLLDAAILTRTQTLGEMVDMLTREGLPPSAQTFALIDEAKKKHPHLKNLYDGIKTELSFNYPEAAAENDSLSAVPARGRPR